MGSRAFHFSAPREWNQLPLSLRSSNLPSKSFLNSLFLLGFQRIGNLIGIHLVADYSRLRFTFRCDLARVINLSCVLYCNINYIGLHMVSQIYSGYPPPPPSPLPLFEH